jgi:outer membrane protein TolC
MKFSFNLFSAIMIFLMAANTFGQQVQKDSLSLNEVVKLALTNQPLLQEALHQVDAASAKIKEQKSYNYPNIAGDVSYVRIGPIPVMEFGGMGFTLAPANNYDAHISASDLLYDFGKRDALIDLAKSYKLSSEDEIKLIKNNLTYQTIAAFYTALFLEKSIDVKNEQIKTYKQHLEETKKKVQSGSATDFDILTTEVRVAAVENQKIDIENALAKEKILLKSLLGWPAGKELNLSGELKIDSSFINSNALLEKAFNKRPEMKLARDAENSATIAKQVASLEDKPTLSVMAAYGVKNGFEPNLDVLRGNWSAGLNASFPIFNGNLKDAKVEEAEANLQTSSVKILELERNIKAEVEQAIADLNASKSKIRTSEIQVKQAKDAVARAEVQYKAGVITNLDLLDAETALSEAELQYIQVIYNNIVNSYSLDKAVGKDFHY